MPNIIDTSKSVPLTPEDEADLFLTPKQIMGGK